MSSPSAARAVVVAVAMASFASACAPKGEVSQAAPPADSADAGVVDAASSAADGQAPGAREPQVTTKVLTTSHRFIPNAMFGGWGPHLGHLVGRALGNGATETWFADDACEQAGKGGTPCDVNVDARVDYWKLPAGGDAFVKVASQALPGGVQQNTGSLLEGDTLFTYGIDVVAGKLVECSFDVSAGAPKGCALLPFAVGPFANYVGAALSPQGAKVVWFTNVGDGGGGQFQWYVDFGGGWNGPRVGGVAGYNDASYIHVAFGSGARQNEMLLHAQLVSGVAPNWNFFGATGAIDLGTASAATFALSLAPAVAGDPVVSTNDVAIDPVTNDAHLVARTDKGHALYYFRPAGGTWSSPLATLPNAYRARVVVGADGTLLLAYGPSGRGLVWRASPPASRAAGRPVDWSRHVEHVAPLPPGYESLLAIYPQASVYQSAPVTGLRLAVVGTARQNEVLYVAVDP